MKLCLVCSAGGHLVELQQLSKIYKDREHFFMTFKRHDSEYISKNERVYFIKDPERNPVSLAINFLQSLYILLKERPDAVITTGAGVAVIPCYIAKLLGKKVIYIESLCRISEPSLSGEIVYRIADLFLVQWAQLKSKYGDKAIHAGSVF